MATTCTEYRIEFLSVHTGRWLFFMQFKDFATAKKIRKATIDSRPDIKLRIKQIHIKEGSISETIMEDSL